ncbi:hypothetical protein C8A05DRAFT_46167 [Staphylotrichum tortipilum]|uniref:Uncharacterized protein n=1 Tax=Staphylotrichum tortipilum TaxID=2831512 RepID=A0AAN6RRW2_9PEZI|nr:hypothetical protein C8A05DRAFT_46167 [Staphylotrichum longicolle]
MVSNKKRLYVALYPSSVTNNEERMYHWGFLIGPKREGATPSDAVPGVRYHVKNTPTQGWFYYEVPLTNVRTTANLLARIVVAKVTDEARLITILRETPVVQNHPAWRCRTWVADALRRIEEDGTAVGTSCLYWGEIERTGRGYDLERPKPTWDLLEGRETVP